MAQNIVWTKIRFDLGKNGGRTSTGLGSSWVNCCDQADRQMDGWVGSRPADWQAVR